MSGEMSATSSLRLDARATASNNGRPVYDVCHACTVEPVLGRLILGADGRWRVEGAELDSWSDILDAVRMIMAAAS